MVLLLVPGARFGNARKVDFGGGAFPRIAI
jgi:hypothetical protein